MKSENERLVALVDDDASVRRSVSSLLQSLNFRVESFESAEAFLQSPLLASTGCLVLDLELPGMQGLDLLRQLASAGPHIPVVILTAHSDDAMRERALQAGAIAFLSKPFKGDALVQAVRPAIDHI